MDGKTLNRRFGIAWLAFAASLAIHVTDEATHDFLTTYNASVHAIRARLPFLPIPTFTFSVWLTGLIAGILLLLCLAPLAFRGSRWLRIIAWPLALIVGIFNALLHMGSSLYLHRWMPGVLSAPLLFLAAIFLLARSRCTVPRSTPDSVIPGS
jgi:drug/metabolite transporter (DMT)-like permease